MYTYIYIHIHISTKCIVNNHSRSKNSRKLRFSPKCISQLSLLRNFISDFENPSQKTRERNYKFCVRLFERIIKASNLRFASKCRHFTIWVVTRWVLGILQICFFLLVAFIHSYLNTFPAVKLARKLGFWSI